MNKPKLHIVGGNVEAMVNMGPTGTKIAGEVWRAVIEGGANGIAIMITYPNGSVGTGYDIGRGGSYFALCGGLDLCKARIMEKLL